MHTRYRYAIFLIVVLVLGLRAFVYEPYSLHVEEHELVLPNWPASCDGLRVAVLADLHVGSPFNDMKKLDKIVAKTSSAKPDLVLLAGDFVVHGVLGGTYRTPEEIAPGLARLSAPLGVWSVMGNHDWWLDAPRVIAALAAVGIRSLEDMSTELQHQGCSFWLTGISDYWEGAHDIAAALAMATDARPVVAFTHNPDLFPEMPSRVNLTIAGHTHGGQVDFPLVGRLVVPSKFGERYAAGHVVEQGRHLFVSQGLGTSILPVRFRVPPEISVLVLRSGEASSSSSVGF